MAMVATGSPGGAAEPAERHALLRPFYERIRTTPGEVPAASEPLAELPADFVPWWQLPATTSMAAGQTLAVDLEGLLLGSLEYSARIRFLAEERRAAQTGVAEAAAAFDWRSYADSRFVDTSDPVGSLLTTGGSPRYRDHTWTGSAGLRRRTPGGGEFQLSQGLGYEENNSIYFVPPRQGTSIVAMSFSRPLLRGAGADYTGRLIALAEIDARASNDEFLKQSQAHLVDLARTYWQLYLARASLAQKRRLSEEARQIHRELEQRRALDALVTQILLAKAAVAKRAAEIIRGESSIKNTEARVRALVNDPRLSSMACELVPAHPPGGGYVPVALQASLYCALQNRPEIAQAIEEISAARVKLNVSENELLPALDLVLEVYSKGLAGHADIAQALEDEFSRGEPSYTAGLAFEMPLGNRSAKARNRRQQVELRKMVCGLAAAVEIVLAEVEIAVREVQTAYREMGGHYHAMVAKQEEVRCVTARWRALAGEGDVASVLLQQLLQGQEDLTTAEFAFTASQVDYNIALVQLRQAEGVLLQMQRPATIDPYASIDPPLTLGATTARTAVDIPGDPRAAVSPLPPASIPAGTLSGQPSRLPASPERLPPFMTPVPTATAVYRLPAVEGVGGLARLPDPPDRPPRYVRLPSPPSSR